MRRSATALLLCLVLMLPSVAFGAGGRAPADTMPEVSSVGAVDDTVAVLADIAQDGSSERRVLSEDPPAADRVTPDRPVGSAGMLDGTLDVISLAGTDRFDTAIRISQHAYPFGSEAVVITNGNNWPDALSGAPLAGMLDAPILLTSPAALPAPVADEISRLEAGYAVILGGASAVSSNVEAALVKRLGAKNVLRIDGRDRYETSAKIAMLVMAVQAELFGEDDGICFVATGGNFPDALGASPLAAATWWPIVLVNPAGVGQASAAVLAQGARNRAVLLGGTGALSDAIADRIGAMVGREPLRLWGTDRYETARVVATWGVDQLWMWWDGVAIATGQSFPDALAGGVMQGLSGSVMLLTPGESLPVSVAQTLADNANDIYEVRYLGGTRAVGTAVRQQVESLLFKAPVPDTPGPIVPVPSWLWEPWAILPDTGNYVYLDSDPGDYIGGGNEYLYTPANATIAVTASGGYLSISVTGYERWQGSFQVPETLGSLQPGYYPGVTRYPFHDPEWGGLSWSGEGRGSNTLTGWFVIDSVTYEAGVLKAIELRFEQHSEGKAPALHGAIRWSAADVTTPPGPVNPIPETLWRPSAELPADGTYVHLDSDTGDYIGGGKQYLYTPANATISVTASGGLLSVSINGAQWWYGRFRTMNTISELQTGYYPGLTRYPFHNPAAGGLDWWGEGRGSNTLTGWFVIDSVTYEGGVLKAIELRFEQHSEGATPALHGAIRWSAGG